MVTELIWKIACSINNDYDTLPAELKEKKKKIVKRKIIITNYLTKKSNQLKIIYVS